MIASGLVLFLFGTVVSAGPFIPPTPTEIVISKNKHSMENQITEYYPSSGQQKGSPFISNFIQSGTNVFFKPQFMLAAAQMPPQVQAIIASIEEDDCKTSLPLGPVPVIPLIEEPLRIVEKEIYTSPEIKEVIEINSVDLPQSFALPGAPLIVEEPCLTGEVEQVIIPEAPLLPAYIPRIEMPMPSVTTVMEIEQSRVPVVIPPAPELPPMEFVPQVPTMVEEVLVSKDVPAPEVIIEAEQPRQSPLQVVPPAPVLPPMEMPKLPLVLEEIPAPVEVIQEIPVFTSFIPETYVRDVVVEEKPAIEPVHAIIIPEAPVLPPFEMPKLSVLVEEAKVIPCPPSEETHEITSVPIQPMIIPEAPVLPPYVQSELPAAVIVEESRLEIVGPVELPRTSVLQPIELPKTSVIVVNSPEPCDTVEIIEDHVRPMVIPEAPALPPYEPLEIPTPVVVKEPIYEMEQEIKTPAPAPVLEPFELPKAAVVVVDAPEQCETVEIVEDHVRPMVIPEAPVLPPYKALEIPAALIVKEPFFEVEKEIVRPVEVPMEPIVVVNSLEPCDTIEMVEKHVDPMVIPKAPILPPYNYNIHFEKELKPAYASVLPPMEILVERPAEVVAPCPPGQEDNYQRAVVEPIPVMPFAYPELSLTKPVVLPSAQNIPEYLLPYFSMLNKNVIKDKSIIIENNSPLAIPKDCAHDLVVEHISPNMEWK